MIKLYRGYFGAVLVEHMNGCTATFPGRPGDNEKARWRKILTGVRNKYGECTAMTAPEVLRFYRVTPRYMELAIKEHIELDDDKGLFGIITADDLLRCGSSCHGVMPMPVQVLAAACVGDATKRRTK